MTLYIADNQLYMSNLLLTDNFVSVHLRSNDDSSILPDPFDIHIHVPNERKIHIKFPEIATEDEDSRVSPITEQPKPITEQPKVATSPPKVMTLLTTEKPAEISGIPEVVTTLPSTAPY